MNNPIRFLDIWRSNGSWRLKLIKAYDHVLGGILARVFVLLNFRKLLTKPGVSNRLLVIRPGGIGDAVFTLPFIRSFVAKGWVVDVLCENRNAEVYLSQEGLCHRIFRYDRYNEFVKIFANEYDVIVDTEQWHMLTAIIARLIPAGQRVGFNTRLLRSRLYDVNVEYDVNEYELLMFQRLFEGIDPKLETVSLQGSFCISQHEQLWASGKIEGKLLVVGLGSSVVIKKLPINVAGKIIKKHMDNGGAVVLVGGDDAKDNANEIVQMFEGSSQLHNYVGQLSLIQTAALVKHAGQYVGPDSGLLHIAVALGVSTLGVFGPSNHRKWAMPTQDIISKPLPCKPCARFGYIVPTCRGKFGCVDDLDKMFL